MRISDGSSDGCSSDLHRARIVEVRLPLCLRRAQRVQYAVAAVDRDRAPAAREGDRLTDPVAGVGAAEDRVFENRVEAAFGVVIRIAVAGRVQPRQAETNQGTIIAAFEQIGHAHIRARGCTYW